MNNVYSSHHVSDHRPISLNGSFLNTLTNMLNIVISVRLCLLAATAAAAGRVAAAAAGVDDGAAAGHAQRPLRLTNADAAS